VKKDLNMSDDFSLSGIWFLPENDKTLSGDLNYLNGEKISLNAYSLGKIEDINNFFSIDTLKPNVSKIDIILGQTNEKGLVTLYDCYNINSGVSVYNDSLLSPVLTRLPFNAEAILIGKHFVKKDDITFESIIIEFTNLNSWAPFLGHKRKLFFDNNNKFTGINFNYSLPDDIKIDLENGLKFNVLCSFNLEDFSRDKRVFNFVEKIKLEIGVKEPKNLDFFISTIHKLERFFTLAMLMPIYALSVRGKIKENHSNEKVVRNIVEIFYRANKIPANFNERTPKEMLFTYDDISEDLKTLLDNWFAKYELLEPILNLYFNVVYIEESDYINNFLNLAQALESFHGRIYGKNCNEKTGCKYKHCEKVNKTKNIPLIDRLKCLLIRHKEKIEKVITDLDDFAKTVSFNRNYYTHYDRNDPRKVKKGVDLFNLTNQMKFLFQLCLLSEIGLDEEKIIDLLSGKNIYRSYFQI